MSLTGCRSEQRKPDHRTQRRWSKATGASASTSAGSKRVAQTISGRGVRGAALSFEAKLQLLEVRCNGRHSSVVSPCNCRKVYHVAADWA